MSLRTVLTRRPERESGDVAGQAAGLQAYGCSVPLALALATDALPQVCVHLVRRWLGQFANYPLTFAR